VANRPTVGTSFEVKCSGGRVEPQMFDTTDLVVGEQEPEDAGRWRAQSATDGPEPRDSGSRPLFGHQRSGRLAHCAHRAAPSCLRDGPPIGSCASDGPSVSQRAWGHWPESGLRILAHFERQFWPVIHNVVRKPSGSTGARHPPSSIVVSGCRLTVDSVTKRPVIAERLPLDRPPILCATVVFG
jgi:hypothetical protein